LTGTAKTNFASAKSTLDTRYTQLVDCINSAISDGQVTDSEKTIVNTYYALYKNALSTYSTRYEEAHAFMTASINSSAGDALAAAEAASALAGGKATVYYNTSTSYVPSGVKTNDLLCTGLEIYRWNGSSWVFVSEFYNTKTVINGGLISTGALIVGTSASLGEGGIAGGGTIRIWSGGSVTSGVTAPGSATFTVDKDGVVSSKNSFIVYDANGTQAAGFTSVGTNWGGTGDVLQMRGSLRMWVGGEYASRDNSHFKVYTGGVAQMSGIIISNVVNPSDTDQYGVFGTSDVIKFNQTILQCRSSGTDSTRNSFTVDSGMVYNTLSPYVDIRRPASSGMGTTAVSVSAPDGVACVIKGGVFHIDNVEEDFAPDILLGGKSNVFLFLGSSTRTRLLPSTAQLETYLAGIPMFTRSTEIKVIQHTGSSGSTIIKGTSDAPLLNNSGGYAGGSLPGQITLTAGDCVTFRYLRGGWYIVSSMT
jgi:hypothetical protein